MIQRMLKKIGRCAAATLCVVGLSLASVGCEENNQGIDQIKQKCSKGDKCCKVKKACKEGCKKACCTSAKKCGTEGKKCDTKGKKACGKKA